MQKKFIRAATLMIALAMVVTVATVFIFQTIAAYDGADVEFNYIMGDLDTRMEENDEEIAQLKEAMGQDYLVRARAFAKMLEIDPTIADSKARMNQIMKQLDVDEIHVIDGNGIITASTVDGYLNFDMASAEQTAPFLEIVRGNSRELAQEAQPNGTEGILFQYVGVERLDAPGCIQIGMEPTRLTDALANNDISLILRNYCDGEEGAFALDADGVIVWHEDPSWIGRTADELGMSGDVGDYLDGYHDLKLDGAKVRIIAQEMGDYIITAYIYRNVFMADRTTQITAVIISDILVILVMAFAINTLLKRQIVGPLKTLMEEVQAIGAGGTDATADVRTCEEFSSLSDSVNAMVGSIGEKIEQTRRLVVQQQAVARQVGDASETLRALSDGNLQTADRLADGAAEQTAAADELSRSIDTLALQMQADSQRAGQAGEASAEAGEILKQGTEELRKLAGVMREMNQMSGQIQSVVKAIDDISFQTNILALNAAVEAARAGAAGKGFAVVADEVRNLAGKSAESAKQTAEMIGHTVEIMEDGEKLSQRASEIITDAQEKAYHAGQLTREIVEESARQNETVQEIRGSSEKMNNVIAENSRLAGESRNDVGRLMEEVQRLQGLAGTQSGRESGGPEA